MNYPDNVSANDPEAPWNLQEQPELSEDIQAVIDAIDTINLWIYHTDLKMGDRRFEPEYDTLDAFRELVLREFGNE